MLYQIEEDHVMVFQYSFFVLVGTFISSISQVMLKKSSLYNYDTKLKEYLNPLVIVAYIFFFVASFFSVIAYRGISLSMGTILESTSYIYVTIFGMCFFDEKVNVKRCVALMLILVGIIVFAT